MKTLQLFTITLALLAAPLTLPAQSSGTPASNSTITPVQDLPALFQALDKNKDGMVTMEEFGRLSGAMAGIGSGKTGRAGEPDSSAFRVSFPNDQDLTIIFKRLDIDGNGTISATEFMRFNEVMAAYGSKK